MADKKADSDKPGDEIGKTASTGDAAKDGAGTGGAKASGAKTSGSKASGAKSTGAKASGGKSTAKSAPAKTTKPGGTTDKSPDPAKATSAPGDAKVISGASPAKDAKDAKPTTDSPAAPSKDAGGAKTAAATPPSGATSIPASGKPAGSDDAAGTTSKKTTPLAGSAAPAVIPSEPERRGGFWPLVLGGIVAAGIGFGAAWFVLPELGLMQRPDGSLRDDLARIEADQAAALEAQEARIEELAGSVGQGAEPPDLSGLEAAQEELRADLDALSDRMNDAEAWLEELDGRPAGDGTGSDVAASDVAALRQALDAQKAEMDAQRAEIDALTAEAQARKDAAEAAAADTLQRAALTRVRTALDTGTAFESALADLEATGAEVPQALRDVAAEGVPTLPALQESFPDGARAALAASRAELADAGEAEPGVMAFLSDQLGARSLEPREGDDPDAVLSRAEFALTEGRLRDVLAEIETLPTSGRSALDAWAADARTRLEAVDAADALGAELN